MTAMNNEFSRLFLLCETETISQMYAEDGKLMVPGAPPAIGRAGKKLAIRIEI